MLEMSAWSLHLIGEKASPAARDSSEAARALNRRCYPHIGKGGHRWQLSRSPPLPVGFSIQDEAMDVAWSALQGGYCHADVIYLLHYLGIKKGAWDYAYTNVLYTRWATHLCILFQMCDAHGASLCSRCR